MIRFETIKMIYETIFFFWHPTVCVDDVALAGRLPNKGNEKTLDFNRKHSLMPIECWSNKFM